jgi:hypothetical protein
MAFFAVLLSVKFGNMIVKVSNEETHFNNEIDFHRA